VTGDGSFQEWAAEAESAAGVARVLAPTPFVPDQLKVWENPEVKDRSQRILDVDSTVAVVTAVLLAGQELGFGKMASLRSFTIIRGQVAMYALAARALLLHHGHEVVVVETTGTRAIVRGRRAGEEQWQESRWDIERAKIARLYPGAENGQWRTQTQSMLVARATAEASRWVAADAMLGIPALVEELELAVDGQGPPAAIEGSVSTEPRVIAPPPPAVEPPKGRTTRRRTSPPRAALPSAAPSPPTPPTPPPEPVPPEPAASRSRITKPQLTKLHVGLKALGINDRVEALGMISVWANRRDDQGQLVNLPSTGDLTPDEADSVLNRLEALRTIAAQDTAGEPEPGPPDDEPA
jgi:hypothetical protein